MGVQRSELGVLLRPRHGRREVNARAWRCLETCRRKLALREIPLPVPIENWIEGPLGVTFGFANLSHLGADVLGAVYMAEREIVIDERVLSHEGRMRFTCAHELGHLVLHEKVSEAFQEKFDDDPFADRNLYERQADSFAAAFLMPVPLLERELVAVLDERKLKRGDTIAQMTQATAESEWLWRNVMLPRIARRFNVSWTTAVYRFHDVETRLSLSWPLLPYELIERLLVPLNGSNHLGGMWIEEGRLSERNLFDTDVSPGITR